MGKNNSSLHRVYPFMNEICDDPKKLKQLLDLVILDDKPTLTNINFGIPNNKNIFYAVPKKKKEKGTNTSQEENILSSDQNNRREKGLRPPKNHLIAMKNNSKIRNSRLKYIIKNYIFKNKKIDGKKIRRYDFYMIARNFKIEAIQTINNIYSYDYLLPKHLHILEGKTYPDIFIETDECIILAEGKWTEHNTTTSTKYLKKRNQMTRHIQCALDYVNAKKTTERAKPVYAFYIIDENFLKNTKNTYITKSEEFKKEALESQTIPLCSDELKNIYKSYKGYTTWQAISKLFHFSFKDLE